MTYQLTVTDTTTTLAVTESPVLITEQVAGIQGLAGTNGTNGTNGTGYSGVSSTTSQSITTGSKTFALTTTLGNHAYIVGERVRIIYDTSNYVEGTITAVSSSSMTVNVTLATGSGTYTAWTFAVTGLPGSTGATGPSGVIGVDAGELTNTGTSSAAQLGLATAGTAGEYTKVTTDAFGRITSGTTLSASDVPTLNQNTTGNATTATTASAVPASGITGTTLASNVVTSSLTTVGTIGSGTWQGTAIDPTYGGTGLTYGTAQVGGAVLRTSRNKAVNDTANEAVFFNDANTSAVNLNVDANTVYWFEGSVQLSKPAMSASGNVGLGIFYTSNGTAALTPQAIAGRSIQIDGSGGLSYVSISAVNTNHNSTSSTGTAFFLYQVSGYIYTHASTAGKLNLYFTQSRAGSSVSVSANSGSYFNIYKMGTAGAKSIFGNWS